MSPRVWKNQRGHQPDEDDGHEEQATCDGNGPTLAGEQQHLRHEYAVEEAAQDRVNEHPAI
jgi:hypothetical protein